MKFLTKIKEKLNTKFKQKEQIQGITINLETVQKICALSAETYPKEFLAFFEGKITWSKIEIKDILFQPYIANENSAFGRIDFPTTSNVLGSVHSHPGPSNRPSGADLRLFGKTGIVHAIIKHPYSPEDIEMYDTEGNKLNFSIK